MAFDFKKAYKALYMPQNVPELITVPPANYIAVRGHGDPNEEGGAYKQAIEILYSVAYTLKMSYKTEHQIEGFPEETEEEFAASLDFIRRCGFAQMHIFPYSVRPGTPAAGMTQITKAVKEERAHRAAAVAEEMHRAYLNGCVGQTYPVLFEQPKNGKFAGHAPNYMEVLAEGTELHNKVRNVTITVVEGESLLGRIQED